ncbi:MRN complex-interacting protein-like isoform X1 [Lasioglossum baleicum]|uniref:MRN complex-interacting protein-like isoform X1 n=1 Tax=Lasioglossum baleicum TaxID=434251 RepID=UPI003FCD2EF0
MPQHMNILCCYSCNMYQVHIVKKAKNWQCKICNAKQSFRRIFFQGSGKDCRIQVQKLNAMKAYEGQTNSSFETVTNTYDSQQVDYTNQPELKVSENKWAKYLDTSDEALFNTVQVLDHEQVNDETNNSVQMGSENTYGCSQSSHSYYNKDSPQNVSLDDEEEFNNLVEQELHHTELDTKNESKSNNSKGRDLVKTVDAITIFDDNEDFDLAIDF